MTATADMILERRRVRRRLAFWRIVAIVAIVVAAISFLPGPGGAKDHIARVSIDGLISSDEDRERAIRDIAGNDAAKALIVRIDSPGGTVVASEDIYRALRRVADQKPVVAVMDELAASGGYVAALAGERIIARGNTLTGSIGVVMEAPNIEELLAKLGVGITRIKSGPLKGEPSLTAAPSAEAMQAQEALIADTFDWFRDLVAERRNLDGHALARVSDGRAFTGRQALQLGLIDAIGDEETARDWLAEKHGVGRGLDVVEHRWGNDDLPWPLREVRSAVAAMTQLRALADTGPRLYAVLQ